MISDGLACFRAVAEVGLLAIILLVVKGRHPQWELPNFRWINTVSQQLENQLPAAASIALRFEKYA